MSDTFAPPEEEIEIPDPDDAPDGTPEPAPDTDPGDEE
jgi:hypothetical protein